MPARNQSNQSTRNQSTGMMFKLAQYFGLGLPGSKSAPYGTFYSKTELTHTEAPLTAADLDKLLKSQQSGGIVQGLIYGAVSSLVRLFNSLQNQLFINYLFKLYNGENAELPDPPFRNLDDEVQAIQTGHSKETFLNELDAAIEAHKKLLEGLHNEFAESMQSLRDQHATELSSLIQQNNDNKPLLPEQFAQVEGFVNHVHEQCLPPQATSAAPSSPPPNAMQVIQSYQPASPDAGHLYHTLSQPNIINSALELVENCIAQATRMHDRYQRRCEQVSYTLEGLLEFISKLSLTSANNRLNYR